MLDLDGPFSRRLASEQDGFSELCATLRLYSKQQLLTVSVYKLTLVLTAY